MNKCYNDVKAFMLLGQPDMVARELRSPVLRKEDDRSENATGFVSALAEQMIEASKDIRILPLHGKPHPTRLGLGLMLEELGETIQAAEQGDLAEFADGLADLIYVATWTALAHGIDLPAVWAIARGGGAIQWESTRSTCAVTYGDLTRNRPFLRGQKTG